MRWAPLFLAASCARSVPVEPAASPLDPPPQPPREVVRRELAVARAHCGLQLSRRARETPATHRDDPTRHQSLEAEYEREASTRSLDDPERSRLLDAAAARYVAEEQWAWWDLERVCAAPVAAEAAPQTVREQAKRIDALAATVSAKATGAELRCKQLAAEHPRYRTHTSCRDADPE